MPNTPSPTNPPARRPPCRALIGSRWFLGLLLLVWTPGLVSAQDHSTEPAGPEEPKRGVESAAPSATVPSTVAAPEGLTPRIHNPQLFEKSARAAAAAVGQYGTTDPRFDGVRRNEPGQDVEFEQRLRDIERVQRIGYQLAMVAGFDKYPFTFGVVDMPIPNAFALPAGQIFVTQGMLDLGLTDDQLAALLGHEIAHVTEEHFLRIKRKATLLNSLATLVTVGAVAASSSSSDDYYRGPGGLVVNDNPTGDLVSASLATGAVVSELLLRKYSREHEDQSDETGQRLAAAAGFDPDGARQLMAKMNLRIPQDKSFGYWQTHPFFDERVLAAEARSQSLVALEPPDPQGVQIYRQATQDALLNFRPKSKNGNVRPDARRAGEGNEIKIPTRDALRDFLDTAALRAWPRGPAADRIRLERLRFRREVEMTKLAQSRDYGRLIRAYQQTAEEISRLDETSAALATIAQELGELRSLRDDVAPISRQIFDDGVFQTSFLETYLSNFPEGPKAAEATLQLGIAYSRLQREADAVEQFLDVWTKEGDGSTIGQQAGQGLRNLAPVLVRLTALEQLARQDRDPGLADAALTRLQQQAHAFEELANGAEYLRRHPEGLFTEAVGSRLEQLAENLYREMRLYEEVGDSAKAIARANQILEHAPLSRAAQRLSKELADEEIDEDRDAA